MLGRCQLDQPVAAIGLPAALHEVSGLARVGRRLLAHQDEAATVFELDPLSGEVVHQWDLSGRPKGDFEGIAVTGDGIALMTSAGELFLVGDFGPELSQIDGNGQGSLPVELSFERVETGLDRHCELEGLAYDAEARVLLIPCKVPRDIRYEGSLIVLRWSLEQAAPADPGQIVTPAASVTRALGFPRVRPTAVEWDSVTGRLLVLSAQPQAVLEVTPDGRLVAALRLDPRRHPQPEGLTLVGDRLVIADEGNAAMPGSMTSYACAP